VPMSTYGAHEAVRIGASGFLGPPDARRARVAVTAVFFVHGLLFASWVAHIPHVKEQLRLGNGALGFALLGAPVGSVLAMTLAARLLPRLGSRRVLQIALVGYCVAGPLVGLGRSLAGLFLALLAWGVFQGTLDVSMNTQGLSVERATRSPLMSGFHGSWSLGSFAGAALGTVGVAIGLSLSEQVLVLAAPSLLIVGVLTTQMVPDETTALIPESQRPASLRHTLRNATMIVLGAIAFADMLCEGAAAEWSAVYLRDNKHTTLAFAGLGFTVYSLAMVSVRLSGNRLLRWQRPERLLPVLAGVATFGLLLGLVTNDTAVLLAGFGCLGLGLALVVPTVFSAAGRVSGVNPGTAIAVVSAFGWTGFVCGPPLIGQIASAWSLRIALGLLPILTALIAFATAHSIAMRSRIPGQGEARRS
jgi:MFS family permease